MLDGSWEGLLKCSLNDMNIFVLAVQLVLCNYIMFLFYKNK